MTTAYPTALDAFTNPTGSQSQAASRTHSQQHGDLNDAVEALQAKVGINSLATGEVSRSVQAKMRDIVSVKDFGAVGDAATNDTAAFTAALAAASVVYVPAGTYRIESLTIPASKTLVGAGKNQVTLRAVSACTFVVQTSLQSTLRDMTVNGNLVATDGVRINGNFGRLLDVSAQYAVNGFYNVNSDVVHMIGCNTSSNTGYGFYSADRWINCIIDRFQSDGDPYGMVFTYSVQQPQAARISNSLCINNALGGIHFLKDVFVCDIENCIVDDCGGNCLYFGPSTFLTQVDINIVGGFYYSTVVAMKFRENAGNILISGVSAGGPITTQVIEFIATTTARCHSVRIRDSRIGSSNAAGYAINADSVNGLLIDGCFFGNTGNVIEVNFGNTYTAELPLPRPVISCCKFQRGATQVPFTAAGVTPILRDNVGFITRNTFTAQIPNAGTSIAANHGLGTTPTDVKLTATKTLTSLFYDTVGATQLTVKCGSAAAAATDVLVTASVYD